MLRFIDEGGNDLGQGLLPLYDQSLSLNGISVSSMQSQTSFKGGRKARDHAIYEENKPIDLKDASSPHNIATHMTNSSSSGRLRPDDTYFGLDLSSGAVRRGIATFNLRVSHSKFLHS